MSTETNSTPPGGEPSEPGTAWERFGAERPLRQREGIVSDPDLAMTEPPALGEVTAILRTQTFSDPD